MGTKGSAEPRYHYLTAASTDMKTHRFTWLVSTVTLVTTLACSGGVAPRSAVPVDELGRVTPPPFPAQTRARLMVLIVVDQLKADLLDRYNSAFVGGLRRLLDEGLVFENATHDHAFTETTPGHASIATGTYPSRHGMVANQWRQQFNGRSREIFNVVHEDYRTVGEDLGGGAAPVRLERTGLADWIIEEDKDSQVLSISAKDRSAVLLGGKNTRPTIWFNSKQGQFVTSTYYSKSLPRWVERFNKELEELRAPLDSVWTSSIPDEFRRLSRPDTAQGEGDGVHTAFPHLRTEAGAGVALEDGEWLEMTPELDHATLGLARAGILELKLGKDETPDLLTLGLSQTDRVGHAYGPYSREQLDNLLRLDQELGAFFKFLDAEVGADQYVVALTADHGMTALPEYRVARGTPGRRLRVDDREELEELLGQVVRGAGTTDILKIAPDIAEAFEGIDWIRQAWPTALLNRVNSSDTVEVFFARSVYPGRTTGPVGRFGVTLQLEPGVMTWDQPLGSTHGSVYHADRHVPLIFMGPGVRAGRTPQRVATVDIAPTLAHMFGIRTPDNLDGKPLTTAAVGLNSNREPLLEVDVLPKGQRNDGN